MKVSIRTVLIFGFCGLLALSISAVIATGLAGAIGNSLALMTQESVQVLREAERRLTNELDPIEAQSAYISTRFQNGELSFDRPEEFVLALESSLAALPDLAGLVAAPVTGPQYGIGLDWNEDGSVTITSEREPQSDLIRDAVAAAASLSGSTWLQPIWVPDLRATVISYHTPLYYKDELKGLLIIGKTVGELSARLRSIRVVGEQVPFLLYDREFVLAHPDLELEETVGSAEQPLISVQSFRDPILSRFGALESLPLDRFVESERVAFGNVEIDGFEYFFTYRDMEGIGADRPITVGIYMDEERYDPLENRLALMVLAGVIVLAVAIVVSVLIARATIRPIEALSEATGRVAAGDLENIPELRTSFLRELDEGRIAFDHMVSDLRERQRMRDLFGRFMPSSVAEILLREPGGLEPQEVVGTVLFSDLVSFTHLSEQMAPDAVVNMLNAYFTDMVNVIDAHGGIVTQFQGDAIMAVFNVPISDPHHASQAVLTALEMQNLLADRLYEGQRLKHRIGIATGTFVAANVGADSRMNYTVHGDAVNLAARLEAWNKKTETDILIADSTQALLDEELLPDTPMTDLGRVFVRGRDASVKIFTPYRISAPVRAPSVEQGAQ